MAARMGQTTHGSTTNHLVQVNPGNQGVKNITTEKVCKLVLIVLGMAAFCYFSFCEPGVNDNSFCTLRDRASIMSAMGDIRMFLR